MPSSSSNRGKSLHVAFGGGRVADVVMWRSLSSGFYLCGVVVTWLIFNYFNYTFITLLCHISLLTMVVLCAWSNGATHFNWNPLIASHLTVPESAVRAVVSNLNITLLAFHDISTGKNPKHFSMVFVSVLILSFIGNSVTFLNLITCGVVGLLTGPVLYELWMNWKKNN